MDGRFVGEVVGWGPDAEIRIAGDERGRGRDELAFRGDVFARRRRGTLGGLDDEIGDRENENDSARSKTHNFVIEVQQLWQRKQARAVAEKNLMDAGADATVCGHCAVMVELADTLL